MPEQYQQITTQKGYAIDDIRRIRHYDALVFGDENHLGINEVARYLASIGITINEAKTWWAWAAAYVEMELTEHPDSRHAQMLQQAQVCARACIDGDLKWVLKNVHTTLPGYYNPTRDCPHTAEDAEAGPSNATVETDATMHHDAESNVVQLNYQNEKDDNTRMGPG